MIRIILGISALLFAMLCIAYRTALYGVLWYITEKEYTLPTQRELRACIRKYLEKRYLRKP